MEESELGMTCVHNHQSVFCIMLVLLVFWSRGTISPPCRLESFASVHAVSICASTFLTITQASFQQMLLLTSVAWHQVRNSDREPKCLKAIGCLRSEAPLCCVNLYVFFLFVCFVSSSSSFNSSVWHGTNYYIMIHFVLPPFTAFDPEVTAGRLSCTSVKVIISPSRWHLQWARQQLLVRPAEHLHKLWPDFPSFSRYV